MPDERNVQSRFEDLFAQETIWQSWLDVEAALARVQSRIGMIPDWAGGEITAAAQLSNIGADELREAIERTQAPVLALTRRLAEKAGRAGDYVHWGATTQNVAQTGRLLLMQKADTLIHRRLADGLEKLGRLADDHAETLTVARTNRRHALPVTFGFKVGTWIEEIVRNVARLEDCAKRTYCLPFGGAVGAMHAWDGEGQALYDALATELQLGRLVVPSRVVNDLFAERVMMLGLLAVAIERASRALYLLMEEDIGEVAEVHSHGVVGSSTMPHKVNPKSVVTLITECIRLRALAAPAMEAGLPSHEGDASANGLASSLVDEAYCRGWTIVDGFATLIDKITVDPARMRANFQTSGPAIASEKLMMTLAGHIGRNRAHDIVHHVLESHPTDIVSALANDPDIAAHFGRNEVEQLLDPVHHTGESVRIARQAAALACATANRLRETR